MQNRVTFGAFLLAVLVLGSLLVVWLLTMTYKLGTQRSEVEIMRLERKLASQERRRHEDDDSLDALALALARTLPNREGAIVLCLRGEAYGPTEFYAVVSAKAKGATCTYPDVITIVWEVYADGKTTHDVSVPNVRRVSGGNR